MGLGQEPWWLCDQTYVLKVVGPNPSTIYWNNNCSH